MKVAITGGTGFIGGHLANRCISLGHEVRILSRRPEKNGCMVQPNGSQVI